MTRSGRDTSPVSARPPLMLRALLYLYPASFRSEYGPEIERIFLERRQDATGLFQVFALWAETIADTVTEAVPAHWDILRQDLAYTLRALARSPGFTITALAVTALCIGATTAAFSLADHVLLRPLPFPEPDRLIKLWEDDRRQGYTRMDPSPANYRDWRSSAKLVSDMAAYSTVSLNLDDGGDPERIDGAAMTWNTMGMLGARPLMGRTFTAEDDRPDSAGTIILSDALWRRRYGGDSNILGRVLRLDGAPFLVIGVMPPDFAFPSRTTTFWKTERFSEPEYLDRGNNYLRVLARLRPGVTLEQVREEMRAIGARLEREWPKDNEGVGVTVTVLRDEIAPRSRWLLLALAGAAACVLLIGCTNLASLLLARSLSRRKELAVRAAIGAGRERLVRQLLTESLLLAIAGGGIGVVLATAALPLLVKLVPTSLPVVESPGLDARFLAISAALSIATGIAFGVLPAVRATGAGPLAGLRDGLREGGGRRERLRGALVVAEITLSIVLLVSCGLLMRALWRLQNVDPGFRASGLLTLRTQLPMPKYAATASRRRFYRQVMDQARALPGVSGAAYVSFLPMLPVGGIWPVEASGADRNLGLRSGMLRYVTPGYFGVMGISLLSGRDFNEADGIDAPYVAVVSESFARRCWPGENPLGRHFKSAFFDRTVVGVVRDIRARGVERESEPQFYLSYQQVPDGFSPWHTPKDLVVRSSLPSATLAPALRRIVAQADPAQPISDIRTMTDIVEGETVPRLVQVRVLGGFAAVAFLLAAVGIHGMLSFAVSMRKREFGVRMALGAQRDDILWMVAGTGARLATAGILLGSGLAWAAGRTLESLLAGVSPGDAPVWGAAILLSVTMTGAGSFIPALRATRVDPGSALRSD